MKWHKVICFFGAALMVWSDKATLLDGLNHTAAQVGVLYLTIALMSVLFGIVATSFPNTAPCAMAVAWNGSLHVFLFCICWLVCLVRL
ncbi:unnamed protein product [Urochloa humidicola]